MDIVVCNEYFWFDMITSWDKVDGATVRSSAIWIFVSRTRNSTIFAGDVFDVLDIILATVTLVSILHSMHKFALYSFSSFLMF